MRIIKTYQITGVNEAHLTFRIGRAKAKAYFEGGENLNNLPARYSTDNPIIQLAIESSAMFGSRITIVSVVTEGEEDLPVIAKSATFSAFVPAEMIIIEEVTTINEAVEYLASRGVVVTAKKEINAKCKELGVSFPNVSLK